MQDGRRRRILFSISKILKLEWCFHREIPRWQSPRQRPPSNRRNDRRDCCYSLLRGIELNFAILHVVVGWHTKGMHFWQGKFSMAKLDQKSEKNWWDILKGSGSFIHRSLTLTVFCDDGIIEEQFQFEMKCWSIFREIKQVLFFIIYLWSLKMSNKTHDF